jgi:hypothetical protein
MSEYLDDAETHAVMLLPGWRHKKTRKLHIRRDCRAVQYHSDSMIPVLIRLDDEAELAKIDFGGATACRYCFPGGF